MKIFIKICERVTVDPNGFHPNGIYNRIGSSSADSIQEGKMRVKVILAGRSSVSKIISRCCMG